MAITFTDEQAAALIEALGLPADTTDADLIVATVADLAAQVAGMNPEKPSTVAAAARKAGLEVVDTKTLAALRTDAANGRQMAAAAKAQKIEAAVDDAVSKGKIAPSRRQHWVTLCTHDEGMIEVLAAVPNETAVPMTEVGHSTEVDNDADKRPAWFY
ncbi:phage protease [Mycolicibacterium smegmatis]|uniref:Mu-like prophage I protein n=1 Tax=Mycolicibacterium smegmatis (strain MKD8) TaxID=1214915 RepID=A0A2U9PVH5_MYCSE|nr:phage protease [Mycolicibacterium smegmatis]AWT55809.1 Mu-like prophage I protein [Mycolicibacterium smegmatis MKD8]